MNRILSTISFMLLLIGGNVAQTNKISREVTWGEAQKIIIDSLNTINRLHFEDAVYHGNSNLPHYFESIGVDKEVVVDYELVPEEIVVIPQEVLLEVDDLDLLSSEFELNIKTSIVRKRSFANIDLIPIRRNPESGHVEALVKFSIMYSTNPVSESRTVSVTASSSNLSQGSWYKFRVKESGVYQIPYNVVDDLGFSNPEDIGVFGFGRMQPKVNSLERYDDLPERPVLHKDNNGNGVFDSGDVLLVYLEGPNEFKWIDTTGEYVHNIHNYSDYSYYFLSDNSSKLRIQTVSGDENSNYSTTSYDYNYSLEKDSINIIGSGRTMYWRHFNYYLGYNFNLSVPEPVSGNTSKLIFGMAARSSATSRFKFVFNGSTTYSGDIAPVSGSYSSAYAIEARHELDAQVSSLNSLRVEYLQANSSSEAWLNYITLNSRCKLKLSNNLLQFRDSRGVANGNVTKYSLSNANASTLIWDVTDPVNMFAIQKDELNGNVLTFTAASDELREFVALNPSGSFEVPQFDGSETLGFVQNQNLHALPQVDFLIITNPLFESYAQQIASLHEMLDGLSYAIVTPQQVYNEFSSGTPDVSALRDFVKMFYDRAENDSEMPDYLLLFGDGSYDNKAPLGIHGNFVPTYQSGGSLSPTGSFVSDDFYGLLDETEGSVSGSEGLDIGIGRIPVKSQQEAQDVVSKIVHYVSPESFGRWKNTICFIGDDAEDYMAHEIQANQMGDTVMSNHKVYNVDKILLDAYEQVLTVQGFRYPEVNQEIDERVNNGALIVNYSGHGNEKTLAHEAVVTLSQINSWSNFNQLPVFVTATCEFSRFDDYELTSAGEQILLNPDGGGVALFSTTRLVYSGDNFKLNTEFYNQVFMRDENNEPFALGEMIMNTKNIASNSGNKRNFSLLGDPALKLEIPDYMVVTDSVNGYDVEVVVDTINAASLVKISGHIEDRSGNVLSDFNGQVYPTIFDKVMDYQTLGNDDNPPLDFKEQSNILYSGVVSVENGEFEFEFIVPVDIAYFYGNGKVSYYAHSETSDAHGYTESLIIGGSSENMVSDDIGPEIKLFMNNTDFVDGGITDEDPIMLAFLYDESGINTVGNGIGHDVTAVLDENTLNSIVLNDFYISDLDSYQSGSIHYPFFNLETGVHTLNLKVWDVFNNSSEAEISFIVANSSELVIEQLLCYPNPMTDYTSFTFTHNHANEELGVEISIYNMNGQLLRRIDETVFATGYSIEPIRWDADNGAGGRVDPGIYVYNVKITAENGDVVNKYEKLVVVK